MRVPKNLFALFFRFFRLLLLAFILVIISDYIQAQQYIPKIIPPSPNAASLFKFTDVPVSTYTGTANVSVPIYTIQAKGLTVPISIDYHTGGIKLKDEAGWVGLGWALTAGGTISRTIMDEDDFGTNKSYFTTAVPQLAGDIRSDQNPGTTYTPVFGPYYSQFICNYLVNTTRGTEDFSTAFTGPIPPYDLEPDLFHYSFPGKSGSFIITRDKKVILQKQDNIKIAFEDNGNSFTITDEHGNVFYFSDKEYTQSATGALAPVVSSWYLTKITTQQQDVVDFHYTDDHTWTYVQPEYYETMGAFCSPTGYQKSNGAGTEYTNRTLTSIDFTEGQLTFSFDNVRADLQEGRKLNNIKLYSKNNGALNYQKEFDLTYSYFSNPTVTNDYEYKRLRLDAVQEVSGSISVPPYVFTYNEPQYQTSLLGKHSASVDHWGYFNGIGNSTFIPTMNIYYNPPSAFSPNPLPSIFAYNGANRNPDNNYMQAFSLNSVKYPTGGKTVFEYEANDYDPDQSRTGPANFPQVETVTIQSTLDIDKRQLTTGTIDLSHLTPVAAQGTGTINLQLLIAFRSSNNDGNVHYKNSNGLIYFKFKGPGMNLTQDLGFSNLTCNSQSPVCSVTLPLSISNIAGPYTWEGYIDPTVDIAYFQDIRVTFQYQEVKAIHDADKGIYFQLAGGLRIKSITDYADDNTIAKKRSYEYNYYDGAGKYSYGKLMVAPSYARYVTGVNGQGGPCNNLTLFGTSQSSLTGVFQGNIVGYDKVTEYLVNPNDNTNIGKTVYSYFNSPDSSFDYQGFRFSGLPDIGNFLNGSLSSKQVYANTPAGYQLVSETQNSYHTAGRKVFFSVRYQTPATGSNGYDGTKCISGSVVPYSEMVCFYPSIKSEWILLDSTKEITYGKYDPSKSITVTRRNYYDNPNHYMVTRMASDDSKNEKSVTKLTYPQDYIPNGSSNTGNTILDAMIDHNMVAEIIEKRDSIYSVVYPTGAVSGAELSIYSMLPSNIISLQKQYKLNVTTPVTGFQPFAINGNSTNQDGRHEQMVSFDRYDGANNIAQYTSVAGPVVSVIWDYAKHYPICETKNATLDNIAYTSFEAGGTGNWSFTAGMQQGGVTGNSCYSLQTGTIVKTGLTATTTYIVSYWTTNGAALSIAGTTGAIVQGKTVNGFTYFEHKVTGVTQVTVPQATGLIDELRLYPADAQMNTYTYSPIIGITSQCSANNSISYYIYDELGRLKVVKDEDGNIIKTIKYNYKR